MFEGIQKAVTADRAAFLTEFFSKFYNVDVLGGKLVSEQLVDYSWGVGMSASAKGTLDSVLAWLTDFRKDISRIDVPTLIMHGDADRILPIAATAMPLSKLIKGARLVVVEGAPHGMIWTHADKVNAELVQFLGQPAAIVTA